MRKKNVFFFVTLIAFIASWPQLCGFNIDGADIVCHLQRIESIKDGILGGQFPVRLEPEWFFGHGCADAVFCGSALLYFPALLRIAGFTVTASYNIYCIALNFATAWIAWYCFGRIFGDDNIGLMCSALYTLSVFRIYRLVLSGDASEGGAFMFIPLVVYGLYRIFTEAPEDRRYKSAWAAAAIGYAGLLQTSIRTFGIAVVLTAAVCLICIKKLFVRSIFAELLKGLAAAAGLSLWYLVPFMDYVLTQNLLFRDVPREMIQERGLFLPQLLYQFWGTASWGTSQRAGMVNAEPAGVGFVLFFVLCVFGILWFCGSFRAYEDMRLRTAQVSFVLGCALLLMTLRSFPWDMIHELNGPAALLVSRLRSPDQFLGWATALLIVVYGFCLSYFRDRSRRIYLLGAALVVFNVFTGPVGLLEQALSEGSHFTLCGEEPEFDYTEAVDWLPEGTDVEGLASDAVVSGENVILSNYEKKYLSVSAECENTGTEESWVEFPILFYKGYRAAGGRGGEGLTVCAGVNNAVRVIIPAGWKGGLKVKFAGPWYWRAAELATLAVLLAFAVWGAERRRTAE